MLTENKPRLQIAPPVALRSLVQNRRRHGSSETDVSELIVAPNNSPSHSVAMMATPVGKVPMTERKRLPSMAGMFISPHFLRQISSSDLLLRDLIVTFASGDG